MAERWEYDVQPLPGRDVVKIKGFLDQMGTAGWELIQIVGENYFFKREKEEGRERPSATQYKREVPQRGHPVG